MDVHGKRVRIEAEGWDTVTCPKPSLGQPVDKMVASGIEDDRVRRFCKGTKWKGLDRIYYKRVFRGDKVENCSVLKKPERTIGEILRRQAEKDRVARADSKQQAATARLWSKAKYCKGKLAP